MLQPVQQQAQPEAEALVPVGIGQPPGNRNQHRVAPDGDRHLCSVGSVQWALNARAAGWGHLTRGRGAREQVALTELPVEQRGRFLRAFPEQVPHWVQFFVQVGMVSGPDPDEFAAAAPRCAVFRVGGDRPVSRPPAPGGDRGPR